MSIFQPNKAVTVVQISDLHLSFYQYKSETRAVDFISALDRVGDIVGKIADEGNPTVLLICGDIFDSPRPDPTSVKAMYKFLNRITMDYGVTVVAIHGNHDYPDDRTPNKTPWVNGDNDSMVHSAGEYSIHGLRIKAINWMPKAKIAEELDAIDNNNPYDILVMHQSSEGMIPEIGKTEVSIAQLAGKARYVAIGDIHITKTIQVASVAGESCATLIVSSGSIERNSSSEAPDKYVVVSKIIPGQKDCPVVDLIPLKNKEWATITVEDEASIALLAAEVEKDPTRVFNVSAKSSVMSMLSDIQKKIKDMGGVFVPSLQSSISAERQLAGGAGPVNQNIDVEEAIDQYFEKDPDMTQISKELWSAVNQASMQQILSVAIKKQVEKIFKQGQVKK